MRSKRGESAEQETKSKEKGAKTCTAPLPFKLQTPSSLLTVYSVSVLAAFEECYELRHAIDLIPREIIDAFCAVGPVDRGRANVHEREGLLDTTTLAVPATGTTREQQDHYRKKLLGAFAG